MRTTRWTRAAQRREREWPAHLELLAQVVEEVSVLAADHRRRKPRQVPRPASATRRGGGDRGEAVPVEQQSVAPAVAAIKAAKGKVIRFPSPAQAAT